MGAGSMTGLPIIETKANDVSAFIPTNVISITDGQCFLEADLFNQGVRPAINVGISVSRVGGAAQVKAMKKVAGSLKLDLAQYDDLKAFAAFASDLDAASRAQLERGARLVELLKQGQGAPVPVSRQVVSVWAGTTGRLDDVPVEDIRRFEAEFLDFVGREHGDTLEAITTSGDLTEENTAALESAVDAFKQQFVTASGQPLVKDEPVEAMGEGEEDLTKIRRRTRTESGIREAAAPDAGDAAS
jgi:F-type H+-transporting ATPase subunit alpha